MHFAYQSNCLKTNTILPHLSHCRTSQAKFKFQCAASTTPLPEKVPSPQVGKGNVQLACPVTLKPLNSAGFCYESGLRYPDSDGIWDLTIGAGMTRNGRSKSPTNVQEAVRSALPSELQGLVPTSTPTSFIFETPVMSYLYERGYRQTFTNFGFPGPDSEFQMARDALREVEQSQGVVMDASCASGLFARRFVQCGAYSEVIAMDYSQSMLQQAQTLANEEGLPSDSLVYVRADIARLPFLNESLDAVHAGAGMHCWPSPTDGVAEIFRVLKPGGVYCGTTVLSPEVPFLGEQFNLIVSKFSRDLTSKGGFRAWDKETLQDIFESCGLVDFECKIIRQFIFFSAKKPYPITSSFETAEPSFKSSMAETPIDQNLSSDTNKKET